MNIKFDQVFELALNQFKQRWAAILGYGILMSLIIGALVIVSIFLIALGAGALVLFAVNGQVGLAILFGLLLVLMFVFLVLPVSYLSVISNYLAAEAAFEDGDGLMKQIRRTGTGSNMIQYFVYLSLPIFALIVGVIIISVIGFIFSDALGIILMLLGFTALVVVSFYLTPRFIFALYMSRDVKSAKQELKAKYSSKQLMYGYLVQVGLIFIIQIVTGALAIIPLVGWLASSIVATLGSVATTQAMIISVRRSMDIEEVVAPSTDVTIESDRLKVTINPYGAQITSVLKGTEEIMWQADPEYWGRTAPVLFPFVGKLKDDQYQTGTDTIAMSQHGFLRDRMFTLANITNTSAEFVYTSTLADYNVYPCDFTVTITYTVNGSVVDTNYKVTNNSSYEMPYQIGAHPAFNVDSVNDLEVVVSDQSVTKHFFAGGLQTHTEQFELTSFDLSYDMINDNLPCYSKFTDHSLLLRNKGQDFLKFNFDSMEYLAIWSPEFKNAKFVCIEPWNGICSRTDQPTYLLDDKDGMKMLAANSSESCSFSFEVC